jgi:hypothetical protein
METKSEGHQGNDPICDEYREILSRFTGRAHKYEGKFIVLIVLLSWRWGMPITLYPGAPPQYRSGVSQLPTSQPLKQGYIATDSK